MEATIPKDFSDWFSPMLVKELRQGLRGRVFVTAFLLIQGFMIFSVLFSLDASMDILSRRIGDALFGSVNAFLLLIVMPCSGLNGHRGEIKGRTLELLLFTGLTPWGVAMGKWKAIVAQSLLVTSTVLPYAFLRYFIGGVNLVGELTSLGLLLATSIILSAVSVVISSFYSMISRLVVYVISLLLVYSAMIAIWAAFEGEIAALSGFIVLLPIGIIFFGLVYTVACGRLETRWEVHRDRE